MSIKLGLKIKIGTEEKDLDDIFLKIEDYNNSVTNNERETGEAVQLTQETGIKYIDENGAKKDLIDRYIGYDSSGYIADNYEIDPSRIDVSELDAIKDKNSYNLVNLFYQLGTKKQMQYHELYVLMHNQNRLSEFKITYRVDIMFQGYVHMRNNVAILLYSDDMGSTYKDLYKTRKFERLDYFHTVDVNKIEATFISFRNFSYQNTFCKILLRRPSSSYVTVLSVTFDESPIEKRYYFDKDTIF